MKWITHSVNSDPQVVSPAGISLQVALLDEAIGAPALHRRNAKNTMLFRQKGDERLTLMSRSCRRSRGWNRSLIQEPEEAGVTSRRKSGDRPLVKLRGAHGRPCQGVPLRDSRDQQSNEVGRVQRRIRESHARPGRHHVLTVVKNHQPLGFVQRWRLRKETSRVSIGAHAKHHGVETTVRGRTDGQRQGDGLLGLVELLGLRDVLRDLQVLDPAADAPSLSIVLLIRRSLLA